VGAGTGISALGFKAGIGTSSRQISTHAGQALTLGVLVQANFSGVLTVCGVPVPPPADELRSASEPTAGDAQAAGNSCVIVLATDAALRARELQRLARRAFAGMARAGSDFSGSSGDYGLAISTANVAGPAATDEHVPGKDLDLLFAAAIEATEEAILNSLLAAHTTTGYLGHRRPAVPAGYVQALVSGRSGSQSGS
jgi:D-aminopeptidase